MYCIQPLILLDKLYRRLTLTITLMLCWIMDLGLEFQLLIGCLSRK